MERQDYTEGKPFFKWYFGNVANVAEGLVLHIIVGVMDYTAVIKAIEYREFLSYAVVVFITGISLLYWIMKYRKYRKLKKGISS